MFKTASILFFISLLLWTSDCKQKNQLAQNEVHLINELIELDQIPHEETRIDRPGKIRAVPEVPRLADDDNPPIILDIIASRSDLRKIRLTDLYDNIKYIPIRIRPPKDSLFASYGFDNFSFDITPNNIFVSSYSSGIYQYDKSGEFISTIVENDFYYTAIPNRKSFMVSKEDRQQFVGSHGKIHAIGDMIYYQYHNNPEQKNSMYKYDATPGLLNQMTLSPNAESQQKAPQGIPLFSLPNQDRSIMVNFMGTSNLFPISEEAWASTFGVASSSKSGVFLVSTHITGDTLTKFQDYDPVKNYTQGQFRSVDGDGTQYYFNGVQHIRQAHNDTIYTLQGTNHLSPKYVLDFGDRGIESTLEGISVQSDLTDKFIIEEFIETADYLFICYSQNAPSPNSAKKGLLFYNACVFDKVEKELFHVYVDKKPFVPQGGRWPQRPNNFIVNNIDHGPAFWPEKATADGSPFVAIKVVELMSNKNLWPDNIAMKHHLQQMKPTDYLLMIAE